MRWWLAAAFLRRRAGGGVKAGRNPFCLTIGILRVEFETFFHRPQTLALGVCNGCQMMSNLRELIPERRAVARVLYVTIRDR